MQPSNFRLQIPAKKTSKNNGSLCFIRRHLANMFGLSASPILTFLALSLLVSGSCASLIGNFTFSAVPLNTVYSPNVDPDFNVTQYQDSLRIANWSAGVSTTISNSSSNFSTSLSLSYPSIADFNNTTQASWDLCAITFLLNANATNISSPGYGSGDCGKIFGAGCAQGLLDEVLTQGGFTAENCESADDRQINIPDSCMSVWQDGTSISAASLRTILNPPSAPNTFMIETTPLLQVENATLVAAQQVYPVIFLERSRVNAPPTYMVPEVAPFICLQAVNNTSPPATTTSSALPTSTSASTSIGTSTAKSDADITYSFSRRMGLCLFLLTWILE